MQGNMISCSSAMIREIDLPDDCDIEVPRGSTFDLRRNFLANFSLPRFLASSITELHLSSNNLTGCFLENLVSSSLRVLLIAHNKIAQLPPTSFTHLPNLTHLDLSSNLLGCLPLPVFRPVSHSLQRLSLSSNPFHEVIFPPEPLVFPNLCHFSFFGGIVSSPVDSTLVDRLVGLMPKLTVFVSEIPPSSQMGSECIANEQGRVEKVKNWEVNRQIHSVASYEYKDT